MSKGSVTSGVIWMTVISVLLFWLPGIGPFIAGLVGGKKSGGVGNAILAVFVPAILIAILLFFFGAALTGIPLAGALLATGGALMYIANIGLLLIGAIIGGVMA